MSVEPLGLDINGTCLHPPVKGGGGMWDVFEAQVEGLGGPRAGIPKSGRIWRVIGKIEPRGLDIGGICVWPPAKGGRRMWDAAGARVEGLRGPGAGIPRMGWFGARKRPSSRTGAISVGSA
jgi:hypothetical protein